MAFQVGVLEAKLDANSTSFDAALAGAKRRGATTATGIARQWKSTGGQFRTLGSDLTRFVSLPIALVGGIATKAAIDFESSFTGVRKTVDGTADEIARLRQEMRDLAAGDNALPVNVNELNRIAELGGQLAVPIRDITKFTRVIAELRATTNITSDEATIDFAKFAGVTGLAGDDLRRLADSIVQVGNNTRTTEQDILSFASQVGGTGKAVGLTAAEIVGLSAGLSAAGAESEAGGTAISKTLIALAEAAEQGGPKLREFAAVAGQSAEEFRVAFQERPAEAVVSFIEGLGRLVREGGKTFAVLDKIGLSQDRTRKVLLNSAAAATTLRDALDESRKGWDENRATADEMAKRMEDTASKIAVARNQAMDAAITFGEQLAPTLREAAELGAGAAMAFAAIPAPVQKVAIGMGAVAFAAGPLLYGWGQIRQTGGRLIETLKSVGNAGLVAKAGLGAVAGVAIGTGIAALLDQVNKLKPPREDLIERLLGDPAEFERYTERLLDLRQKLRDLGQLTDEEFSAVVVGIGEKTPKAVSKIVRALDLLTARHHAMIAEAAQARVARASAGEAIDPEAESLAALVEELTEENETLAKSNLERRIRLGLLQGSVRASHAEVAELLRANEAGATEAELLEYGKNVRDNILTLDQQRKKELGQIEELQGRGLISAEQSALAVAEITKRYSELRGVATTIVALEEQLASLRGASDEALLVSALRREGEATSEEMSRARVLHQAIRAQEEFNEKEREAAEIVDATLTVTQRYTLEMARLNALYEQGFLSIEQYKRATQTLVLSTSIVAQATQQAFQVFLFDPFEAGVKGMVVAFTSALQQMLAEALSVRLTEALFGALGPQVVSGTGVAPSSGPPDVVVPRSAVVVSSASTSAPTPSVSAAASASSPSAPTVVYQIDARGAEVGVEQAIVSAIAGMETKIVRRAVSEVADLKLRGGNYGRVFRGGRG